MGFQETLDCYVMGITKKSIREIMENPKVSFDFNQTTRQMQKIMSKCLPIKMSKNSMYEKMHYLDAFEDLVTFNRSANSYYVRNFYVPIDTPSGRSLRDRVVKMNFADIKSGFDCFDKSFFNNLKKFAKLVGKPIIASIDYTELPFYGNKNTTLKLCGSRKFEGTKSVYKYLVCCIHIGELTFVYKVIDYDFTKLEDNLLEEIVSSLKKDFKIDYVAMDRGFYTKNDLNIFKKNKVYYLMPAVRNNKNKKIMNNNKVGTVVPSSMKFEHGATIHFNIKVVSDDNGEKKIFCSNMPIRILEKLDLSEKYRKRWKIESFFKDIKHSFLPKTTSKNYRYRYFLFRLSCCFYNMWVLMRLWLHKKHFPKSASKDFTAKNFMDIVKNYMKIDFG